MGKEGLEKRVPLPLLVAEAPDYGSGMPPKRRVVAGVSHSLPKHRPKGSNIKGGGSEGKGREGGREGGSEGETRRDETGAEAEGLQRLKVKLTPERPGVITGDAFLLSQPLDKTKCFLCTSKGCFFLVCC